MALAPSLGTRQQLYGPVTVDYVVEVWQGPTFMRALTLPRVNAYRPMFPETGIVSFTLGDDPVIDRAGRRRRDIYISGRSGIDFRVGQDRQGKPLFARGTDLFKEMEKFFASYQSEAEIAQNLRLAPYRMVFRALWEDHNFVVEPQSLNIVRNTETSRHSYMYELAFIGYRVASDPKFNILGDIANKADQIAKIVDNATAYVAFANEYVNQTNTALRSWFEPIKSVARAVSQVGTLATSAGTVLRIPQDTMRHIINIADEAIDTMVDLYDAIPYVDKDAVRQKAREAQSYVEEARRLALYGLGSSNNQVSDSVGTNNFAQSSEHSKKRTTETRIGLTVPHVLKEGETLYDLSEKYYGDTSFIYEIMTLNEMSDVDTYKDGSPLVTGTVILVNAPTSNEIGFQSGKNIFGVDFRFTDGDLVKKGDDDFEMVSGPPLVEQAITGRLITVRGESVFRDYGLSRYIGDKSLLSTSGRIAADVKSQVENDPRIESVRKVVVLDLGASYDVDCEAIAHGGKSLGLLVPIPG